MSFSAVLLCGGESRRMGRDKALVEWNGVPLWKVQLEKLRALRPEKISLSATREMSWRPHDVALVLDDEADAPGPMRGIAASLRASDDDHLLVLAIDLPLMTATYLRSILQRARSGIGFVPTIDARFEPVAAIYPREALGAFDRHARSLQQLLRELVNRGEIISAEVQPAERELFRNVNEPADLIAS